VFLVHNSKSKKALEKGLNYFTQGYIHNIKISEARGAMRVDARCCCVEWTMVFIVYRLN
jgi:hypothetical protein